MIAARAIHKRFSTRVAVDSVTVEVAPGEVFGLLGPNGAGKTTTLSILSTLLAPDRGEVVIDGVDARRRPRAARARIGVVPQGSALYEALSARENLHFLGRIYGLRGPALRRRTGELLELVGLQRRAADPVHTFSGGMKRRLSVVCGLVHSPAALLLDEPTVGLDAQSRAHLLDLIGSLRGTRTAIVYTTHLMEDAERLCDRIAILDRGRVLAQDTPRGLIETHGQRVVEVHEPNLETAFLSLTGRRLRD